tara:strand:- start:15 stop:272 length:258 start_codon:yes stop_codon:yes gene_type:complete
MTASLILAFVWLAGANIIGMFPSRDLHWRNAYILIVLGIPLLGWVTWQNGPIVGLLVLAGGASVLRWPLIYLYRWAKAKTIKPAE